MKTIEQLAKACENAINAQEQDNMQGIADDKRSRAEIIQQIFSEVQTHIESQDKKLDGIREALSSANTAMVHDPRDWSKGGRDAWLYGLFVGWRECSGDILHQHPRWGSAGIEDMKQLRAKVEAVYDSDRDGTLHKSDSKHNQERLKL